MSEAHILAIVKGGINAPATPEWAALAAFGKTVEKMVMLGEALRDCHKAISSGDATANDTEGEMDGAAMLDFVEELACEWGKIQRLVETTMDDDPEGAAEYLADWCDDAEGDLIGTACEAGFADWDVGYGHDAEQSVNHLLCRLQMTSMRANDWRQCVAEGNE